MRILENPTDIICKFLGDHTKPFVSNMQVFETLFNLKDFYLKVNIVTIFLKQSLKTNHLKT